MVSHSNAAIARAMLNGIAVIYKHTHTHTHTNVQIRLCVMYYMYNMYYTQSNWRSAYSAACGIQILYLYAIQYMVCLVVFSNVLILYGHRIVAMYFYRMNISKSVFSSRLASLLRVLYAYVFNTFTDRPIVISVVACKVFFMKI